MSENSQDIIENILSGNNFHMTLDYSAMSQYRMCPRKFWYRYILGYDTESSDALAFGSSIHAGLATWHRGLEPGETIESLIERVIKSFYDEGNKTAIREINPEERRSLSYGEKLLRAYIEVYKRDPENTFKAAKNGDEKLVELSMKYRVNSWLTYSGTCDMIGELSDGSLATIEHKTTSYLGQQFYNKAKPNDQITGYIYLARKLFGLDIQSAVLNGLQTVTTKLDKTPGDCFARVTTLRSTAEISEFEMEMVETAERIKNDIRSGFWLKNAPDACNLWNSLCPYSDVCNSSSENRIRILNGSFINRPWKNFKVEGIKSL